MDPDSDSDLLLLYKKNMFLRKKKLEAKSQSTLKIYYLKQIH